MSYTHTTFAQLKTALANRLGDTANSYWVDASGSGITSEIGQYLIEALQTWGLMTGYWRDSGTLNTAAGTALYNISTLQNTASDPLLSSTVTDTTISAVIQYHLLEPATGSTWTGSEQFTLADVTGALQRRRDQLLLETGATLTLSTQAMGAGVNTLDLSDTILAIRRLSWAGVTTGADWALYSEDINSQRNYSQSYLITPGIPQTYSSYSTRPLRLQIAPPSNEPGTVTVLAVESGATITAAGVALGIPDDMAWIVKWGALADLLGRQGPGQDLPRSYFCERRWRLGVEMAKIYPTVVNAEINGISLSPDSITNLDQFSPNWYSTQGVPTIISSLRNYIALATAPDGVYSVLLDVVRKAVLPVNDSDYIEIGREYLDAILDYAEHLASFKSGGYEFRHTYRGAQNFFNAAMTYNQSLAAKNPSLRELIRQSTSDDYIRPLQRAADARPLMTAGMASDQTTSSSQTSPNT